MGITLGDWDLANHVTSAIHEFCADECPGTDSDLCEAVCICPTDEEPSAPSCEANDEWHDIDDITVGDWDIEGHVTSAMDEMCADECADGGEVCAHACSCPTDEPSAPSCHANEAWNDIDDITLGDWDLGGHVTSGMDEMCAEVRPGGGEVCAHACSCPTDEPSAPS